MVSLRPAIFTPSTVVSTQPGGSMSPGMMPLCQPDLEGLSLQKLMFSEFVLPDVEVLDSLLSKLTQIGEVFLGVL